MAAESRVRAADRDREETMEILRQAYAEGRLDPADLDGRADAALHARTVGELRDLIADIPHRCSVAPLPTERPGQFRVPGRLRPGAGSSPRVTLLALLAAFVLVLTGAVTRDTAVMAAALAVGFVAAMLGRR